MIMEPDQYKTIKGPSEGSYKEKGSKFLAVAIPVTDVDSAMAELEKIRKQYHDARHHCYAYRLGPEGEEFRYNDDGEPSGTAGRPIYGQLLSTDVTDCLVVVTRYFGGTKLGTSGLINAYKTAARDAIESAGYRIMTLMDSIEIRFPYEMMNDVLRVIKGEGAKIREQEYAEDCYVRIGVRKRDREKIYSRLSKFHLIDIEQSITGKENRGKENPYL